MAHGERGTLTTLLALKKRRENNARTTLALLELRETALLETKAALLDERRELWNAWRHRTTYEHVVDHAGFQDLKIELGNYNHRDQAITDRVEAIDAQWNAMQLERANHSAQLRKALVDQEKLKALLE